MISIATGQIITNLGAKIIINRGFKGTPDYTAPTVFSVGTGTTTPVVTDTVIETLVQISGSDTKAIVTGYPTFDETNFVATIRCLLLTTECNGSPLTEFGLKNTDGTAKLFSHAVHTAISKTASIQVIYVEKDKITL